MIDTESLETSIDTTKSFKNVDGILVLVVLEIEELKVKFYLQLVNEKIMFFGICLGMQCAVIDFARNVCKMSEANSTEFNLKTSYPVIDLMNSQKDISKKGATMRLGYSGNIAEKY